MGALFAILTGPVGRWVAAALAVVALLFAVHHHGFSRGVAHEKAAEAARLDRARKDVARREATAAAVTDKARADLGRQTARIEYVTRTLIKEVPVYVSLAADARCVVPVGLVRIHDAAAAGAPVLPAAAGGPLDAPSGVELSAVAATVAENYGAAYLWRAEAMTWRAWYADQAAAWGRPE